MLKSLFQVRPNDDSARHSTATAAAVNFTGFPIELFILQDQAVSLAPIYFSIGVGLLIFALTFVRIRVVVSLMPLLFILNAMAVSFALYSIYQEVLGRFLASELGILVAGLLAPTFLSGLLAIAIHAGSSVIQFLNYSADRQAVLQPDFPEALGAFALAGVLVLIHRIRVTDIQIRAAKNTATLESYLSIRDQINTPVQSIELAATLLEKNTSDPKIVISHLRNSCAKLRELNQTLKDYQKTNGKNHEN